jgi:hypothetical protein
MKQPIQRRPGLPRTAVALAKAGRRTAVALAEAGRRTTMVLAEAGRRDLAEVLADGLAAWAVKYLVNKEFCHLIEQRGRPWRRRTGRAWGTSSVVSRGN